MRVSPYVGTALGLEPAREIGTELSQQYKRIWLEGRGKVKVNRFARIENSCSDRCTPVSLEFEYAGAHLAIRAEPLSLRRSALLQPDV